MICSINSEPGLVKSDSVRHSETTVDASVSRVWNSSFNDENLRFAGGDRKRKEKGMSAPSEGPAGPLQYADHVGLVGW